MMENSVLLGVGKKVFPAPFWLCKAGISIAGKVMRTVYPRIFSKDHYKVRSFLFLELLRLRKPISPEHIAESLNMPLDRVREILDKIGKRQNWIVRNAHGEVTWTYPVTVEETKFKITYNTGEQVWAP
jgi:hypothetical protein